MTAVLETRGLGRAFGALQAVANVGFTVSAGELRAIIGPNGEATSVRQARSDSTRAAATTK